MVSGVLGSSPSLATKARNSLSSKKRKKKKIKNKGEATLRRLQRSLYEKEAAESLHSPTSGRRGSSLSNHFVNSPSIKLSFHEIAGAYLGQEIAGLTKAAEKFQLGDTDQLLGSDLTELKIAEMAKAFLATIPEKFLSELLSVLGLDHQKPRVINFQKNVLGSDFKALKESFKQSLVNGKKNPAWAAVVDALRTELRAKEKKNGADQQTKSISQNLVSRLHTIWKNEGSPSSDKSLGLAI